MTPITGIHHITAVSGSAHQNYRFYTEVLGLKMVKKTVNYDDPATYHLYYGNASAEPGTLLTFFPWEGSRKGSPGAGQVGRIYLKTSPASLDSWRQRLDRFQVAWVEGPYGLEFEDDEGLLLGIAQSSEAGEGGFWGVELPVVHPRAMAAQLESLGASRLEGNHYQLGGHHLLVTARDQPAISGAGTVHHIAFRLPDEESHRQWQAHARQQGWGATPVIDRNYFKAFYFRTEPGILFEVSSDTPGFTVDEPLEKLGQRLQLPPQYEAHRPQIESRLPALEQAYRFLREDASPQDWLLALHGTGGDEHDLLPLARRVSPSRSRLSLRGNVSEQGSARFFRRLAPGVLDEADILRRVDQMNRFLASQLPESAHVLGLGYSNGANLLAAMLLLRPHRLQGAALLRPMLPLEPEALPDLAGKPILILRGSNDSLIPASSTDRCIELFRQSGADLEVHTLDTGHALGRKDEELLAQWFSGLEP